jgi:hypothetical protein
MKNTISTLLFTTILTLLVAGCEPYQGRGAGSGDPTRRAMVGAGGGAAAGAIIGGGRGAAAGAVIGGLLGAGTARM